MSDVTRQLDDYARRLAALPAKVRAHADDLTWQDPRDREVWIAKSLEVSLRILADEMRLISDSYRNYEEAA